MDLARLEVTQKARKVKAKSLQEEKLRLKSTALEKPFFPSDVVRIEQMFGRTKLPARTGHSMLSVTLCECVTP